eukprot:g1788.t1
MDDFKLETDVEENVDLKLQEIQEKSDGVRSELRELEKRRETIAANQELHSRSIGQKMESTMEQLDLIKEKLPPDRLNEASSIKESASTLFSKSRKSSRKHKKLLKSEDITEALIGKWLSVYWPDDNQWWNVFVQSVNPVLSTATLLYETEEAEEIDLKQLVEKGELAWLDLASSNAGTGGMSSSLDYYHHHHHHHTRKKKRHYL